MRPDLFSSADWLKVKNNEGYGPMPIPHQRDSEITALLRAWIALDEPSRKATAFAIGEEQRFTLLAYSERLASLAVRTRDEELVFLGLIALGVDGWSGDWRDNTILIALHYDASKKLNLQPDNVFKRAIPLLPQKAAIALNAFLSRSCSDKTIEAMGYVAGADTDGFRYQRTW